MSDSQQPHGLQPTRLLCPWDFPSKSTAVGCHCLLRQNPLVLYLFFHSTNSLNSYCQSGTVLGSGDTTINSAIQELGYLNRLMTGSIFVIDLLQVIVNKARGPFTPKSCHHFSAQSLPTASHLIQLEQGWAAVMEVMRRVCILCILKAQPIGLTDRSELAPLYWKAKSQPLDHQGSP